MIEKSTTFVVGAGASYEIGLPLGDKLKENIRPLLDIRFDDIGRKKTGDEAIFHTLQNYCRQFDDIRFNDLLYKCWLLRDALPVSISIDNLLDAHRNDEHISFIGKIAISKAILAAERSSALYWNPASERQFGLEKAAGSWLIPLFQRLTENVSRADASEIFNNVCFIVYNYDRCLEYFFPQAISAYYGLNAQEAKIIADKARIYHPYGKVGGLEHGDEEGVAAYGGTDANLSKVANRIRTFTEGLRYESHRDTIREELTNTENLVFLGFAFHPLNMRILEVPEGNSIRKVFATTIGLADAAVRRVREDVFNAIRKRPDDGKSASLDYLDEVNFESRGASDFLYAHFRSLV